MSSMYPFGGAVTRSCMRCGAPLASKESQCSRCGTYNPLPQGQQSGMLQQGGQGAGPSWGAQSPQGPQFPQTGNDAWPGAMGGNSGPTWGSTGQGGGWPQNNPMADPSQSQSFQQNNNFFAPPNGNGFSGQSNNTFSGFPQNPNQSALNNSFFNATRQNGAGTGAPPWSTQNNRQAKPAWMKDQDDEDDGNKKRPSAGVVIVIVILLVALIGGGAFAGYKILKHNSNNSTANTPNATPIATPTGTPLFHETFQNNNAGWDTTPPDGAKVTLGGGKLVLESDNNELFQELFPGGKSYGDFRLDLDVGLTSGDPGNGYGVYVRGASTQNSPLGLFYRFEVYGNGYFYVYKGSQKSDGTLQVNSLAQSLQPSNAVNLKGMMNHLTIIAQGTKLTFMINGTTVANVTDSSYKSGTMALFVSNVAKVPAGAQATFQNIAIFPAS